MPVALADAEFKVARYVYVHTYTDRQIDRQFKQQFIYSPTDGFNKKNSNNLGKD